MVLMLNGVCHALQRRLSMRRQPVEPLQRQRQLPGRAFPSLRRRRATLLQQRSCMRATVQRRTSCSRVGTLQVHM